MRRLPKRYRGFLDDDGSIQWKSVRSHLRSRVAVARMRLDNRWMDARAVLAGACNASTWNEERGDYDGGYSHWRCGKRRGHADTAERMDGAHRFHNYTWEGPGHKVEYAPLPTRNEDNTDWYDTSAVLPFRKHSDGRRAVDSRRRSRIRYRASQKYLEEVRSRPRKISNPFKG